MRNQDFRSRARRFAVRAAAGIPVFLAGSVAFGQGTGGIVGQWPDVASPPGNPFHPQSLQTILRARLGKALFWDEQLSTDNSMSCGRCHFPEAGGGDFRGNALDPVTGKFGSLGMLPQDVNRKYILDADFGVDRRVTGRNSPTMIAAAFFQDLFWDLRADQQFEDENGNPIPGFGVFAGLESQAVEPPVSPVEMAHDGINWSLVVAKLPDAMPLRLATDIPDDLKDLASTSYAKAFEKTFGTPGITRERVAMAIATYERTLVPNRAPFDLGTMTDQQAKGFEIFKTTAFGLCLGCHSVNFFQTNDDGTLQDSNDNMFSDGVSHNVFLPGNSLSVKTPTFRNQGLLKAFFHSGQFQTMDQILAFYNGPQATFGFDPPLNAGDLAAVKAFFTDALTDPRVLNAERPFDRPRLFTERVPFQSNHYGDGTFGSGGIEPVMLANAPPFAGNDRFKVGVGKGLAAARATLGISTAPAIPPIIINGIPFWIDPAQATFHNIILSPSTTPNGEGQGMGTFFFPIPDDDQLVGTEWFVQWFIEDPGSSVGFSTTEAASFEIF